MGLEVVCAQTVAVIDFETSGLMPGAGGRATEVAAVLVREGAIVGRYASLMKSDAWVPPFIEQLTGISNAMLCDAPAAEKVMREVLAFTEGCPLVAHNAAFDRTFWQFESQQAIGPGAAPDPAHVFACTVRLARRLYPEAPNHKLGTLTAHFDIPASGRAHRALADAEVTAHLLLRIQRDVQRWYAEVLGDLVVDHQVLMALMAAPQKDLALHLKRHVLSRQPRVASAQPMV